MALLRASARQTKQAASARDMRAEDRHLRLADGRSLGYAEHGDPHGTPVLFFHGLGTTRLVCPSAATAREGRVRLIAIDRPGIGLSDRLAGRRLLDWPSDVAQLADQLGLGSFSVVGWSGGGPYALATGHALRDRVSAVALVSAPAPLAGSIDAGYLRRFDRNAVRAADRAPWVIRLALWHWGRAQRRDAARFFEDSVAEMCEADQEVMSEPELRGRMIANSEELYRQGGTGMYDEALVLARPWGFDLGALAVPVHIWHGARDTTVPTAMAHHLAEAIPGARLRLFNEEGHHLLYRFWPEILAELTGQTLS